MACADRLLHEFGVKWTIFGAVTQLVIAYLVSVMIFQSGLLFGLG